MLKITIAAEKKELELNLASVFMIQHSSSGPKRERRSIIIASTRLNTVLSVSLFPLLLRMRVGSRMESPVFQTLWSHLRIPCLDEGSFWGFAKQGASLVLKKHKFQEEYRGRSTPA